MKLNDGSDGSASLSAPISWSLSRTSPIADDLVPFEEPRLSQFFPPSGRMLIYL
jgi:hypothetical protein